MRDRLPPPESSDPHSGSPAQLDSRTHAPTHGLGSPAPPVITASSLRRRTSPLIIDHQERRRLDPHRVRRILVVVATLLVSWLWAVAQRSRQFRRIHGRPGTL